MLCIVCIIFEFKKHNGIFLTARSYQVVSFSSVNMTVRVVERAGTGFSSCRTHFVHEQMKPPPVSAALGIHRVWMHKRCKSQINVIHFSIKSSFLWRSACFRMVRFWYVAKKSSLIFISLKKLTKQIERIFFLKCFD